MSSVASQYRGDKRETSTGEKGGEREGERSGTTGVLSSNDFTNKIDAVVYDDAHDFPHCASSVTAKRWVAQLQATCWCFME